MFPKRFRAFLCRFRPLAPRRSSASTETAAASCGISRRKKRRNGARSAVPVSSSSPSVARGQEARLSRGPSSSGASCAHCEAGERARGGISKADGPGYPLWRTFSLSVLLCHLSYLSYTLKPADRREESETSCSPDLLNVSPKSRKALIHSCGISKDIATSPRLTLSAHSGLLPSLPQTPQEAPSPFLPPPLHPPVPSSAARGQRRSSGPQAKLQG